MATHSRVVVAGQAPGAVAVQSSAGRPAVGIWARVAPSAMVFTPCVDGVSHNESEDISLEWATASEARIRLLSGVRLAFAVFVLGLGLTVFRAM